MIPYLLQLLMLFGLFLYGYGNQELIMKPNEEDKRAELLVEVVSMNLKTNGWNNIFCIGYLPNEFYLRIKFIPFTITVTDITSEDFEIDDVVPYHSNVAIISFLNFDEFEEALLKIKMLPNWHPLSNVFLWTPKLESIDIIAKVFFILWHYKIANGIVIQYAAQENTLLLSYYSPFISENYKLEYGFGCWTAKKIGLPIESFEQGFVCENGCYNVSLHSKFRANYLGTCIGFDIKAIKFSDITGIKELNLFEPKGKNLHGFTLRTYTSEVKPFLIIDDNGNDSYTLGSRDGMLWNTMSELLNFTIDLTPSKNVMKLPFDFELSIQQIFSFCHRKVDLLLIPIYQIDLIIVETDHTFAYKDSGVCLASHRADFETILFDAKLLYDNYSVILKFILSFAGSWMVFSLFKYLEKGSFTFDQCGKDFMNAVRNSLLISPWKGPKNRKFRLFLGLSMWCYFILNFSSQAAITSFFTALKKGKEINTFDDIIEKGYIIEGMASPDVVLPETEERFQKINSKLVAIRNIFLCVNRMKNDSRRFCLIDCAVGRYLERNSLNEKGQQFLHIVQDRIHSHYLNMIFPKHSVMTEHYNHYMMAIVEAGIIRKWEQYKFSDIKDDIPTKPLGMDDLIGIFKCYFFLLGLSFTIFLIEVILGNCGKYIFFYRKRKTHIKKTVKFK